MRRRGNLFPVFFLFLIVSLIIFFLSQQRFLRGVTGFFEHITIPLQRFTFSSFHGFGQDENKTPEAKLREENIQLVSEVITYKKLEKENQALRDQFSITNPSPAKLLPAKIIGSGEEIIIDKGKRDAVVEGDIVVYKNNLVGKIVKISEHMAAIRPITHKDVTFTAKTLKTSALGIITSKGEENMILSNVVLTDTLEKNDIVITKGDIDSNGGGFPPDLVVGRVSSINKKASELFQSAAVMSLIDFSKLETVFILVE